jgi:DNA-binding NarL/FixJ family response regulator
MATAPSRFTFDFVKNVVVLKRSTLMDSTKIKIFLVDDHGMLRSGVRHVIATRPNMVIVGEASDGATALKLLAELQPDLVIMDMHLPDMSGIELTRQVLAKWPAIKVNFFSGDADRSLVDEALEAGACGYVWKQGLADELMTAIETVMAGKLYLSPEVNAAVLQEYRNSLGKKETPSKVVPSEQEKRLLTLIAAGQRNKEIAAQLKLSPKSVEAYRSRLMKKLNCPSTAELVRYAIREKIVSP